MFNPSLCKSLTLVVAITLSYTTLPLQAKSTGQEQDKFVDGQRGMQISVMHVDHDSYRWLSAARLHQAMERTAVIRFLRGWRWRSLDYIFKNSAVCNAKKKCRVYTCAAAHCLHGVSARGGQLATEQLQIADVPPNSYVYSRCNFYASRSILSVADQVRTTLSYYTQHDGWSNGVAKRQFLHACTSQQLYC